ncbi:MAG: glutamate--tRNA ligase [Patescibacteria group bacterium]|nr:MAG: glutamate--tRNA ligase [Patescibacteria group bacterium]
MQKKQESVVTRFAPSPTGVLHVGSARTALFNFLFARKHGGKFILRMEDTDKKRSKREYDDDILEGLSWLGIAYDTLYRQSERGNIYKKHLEKLVANGYAYISKEESKEEGKRSEVVRFKNPNRKVAFKDIVRGDIEFDTTELGNFVIAKDMETPLYHLAVVVDDLDMGVTHVIRGEDGISNTPRQILIQEALGAPRPLYAHIPLILAPDRSKLSKRHGAVSVVEFREKGYLPEALVNFLALIGWNPGDEREIFTIDELIKEFSLENVQKGGGVFNVGKLDWVNKEHIKKLSADKLKKNIIKHLPDNIKKLDGYNERTMEKIIPIIVEHINRFGEVEEMAERGELGYFFERPEYEKEKIAWKEDSLSDAKRHINKIVGLLQNIEPFTIETVKDAIWDYATEQGRGSVLWPMRYALSGRSKSPDPFTLSAALGKKESIERLEAASRALN